jgi:hypothetical protein
MGKTPEMDGGNEGNADAGALNRTGNKRQESP